MFLSHDLSTCKMAGVEKRKMTAMTGIFVLMVIVLVGCGAQELAITHAPKSLTFQQQGQPLSTGDIPDVVASTLGLHSQESAWDGIRHGSLFKRPKANVLVTVITHKDMQQYLPGLNKVAKFPVKADQPFVGMENVQNQIQSTFLDQEPLLMDLMVDNNVVNLQTEQRLFQKLPSSLVTLRDRLTDGDSIVHKLDAGSLNSSLPQDLTLLAELQAMDEVISTLSKNKKLLASKTPDMFTFTVIGLKSVADAHGPQSSQTRDAQHLLTSFLDYLTTEFRRLYKDNVVVEVLSVAPPRYTHSRKARSLLQATTPAPAPSQRNLNLAVNYPDTYPAMFNIILWFSIFLAIVFFIIGYAMWFIDPGVDSIIYRMTSQRLKRD